MRKKSYQGRRRRGPKHRINEKIRIPEIRVVGENIEPGIYSREEALKLAEEAQLDLVEVAPNANPPVCKVMDYNKFLYEQKKKEKELKQKSAKTVLKEIRFTPNTDDHDFEFKRKHAEKFLKEGAKVKAYVQFKGRGIMFKERGELLLLKFAEQLSEIGALEQMPKMEGRRMHIFLAPKSTKK